MQDGRSYFTDLLDVDDQPLNPLTPTQWLLAGADVVTFNLLSVMRNSALPGFLVEKW